jgi:hypothetical protein
MTAVSLTPCTSSSLGGKLSSSTKLLRRIAHPFICSYNTASKDP